MTPQDPKYRFGADDTVVSRETGQPIPGDEPVILLRGKDEAVPAALAAYIAVMRSYPDSELARAHADAATARLDVIRRWQAEHPERTGMGCGTAEHVRLADLPADRGAAPDDAA